MLEKCWILGKLRDNQKSLVEVSRSILALEIALIKDLKIQKFTGFSDLSEILSK